jgi:hypothetical protein
MTNGGGGNGFVLVRQTSEEQPNHRHLDQRFARLHLSFVILTHSPMARNPTECALHHESGAAPR